MGGALEGAFGAFLFRSTRALAPLLPRMRIEAFGSRPGRISSIVVVNLDRQPRRLARVMRELGRFRTVDGRPLASIARRFAAVDARDGRAVAATADVDAGYRMGDQLFVQPDARLAATFDAGHPIRMTRQEVAVARSHVEVWKAVANGMDDHVLVLEDDAWFRRGAAGAIDRGWREALARTAESGPDLLYLSYSDAGGTAERRDEGDAVFRPVRGLWFLSGYVLSRTGAARLLRAMPVVGPVDLWMNRRFDGLDVLALNEPVVLQRGDGASDNAYSILPYLARAGVIDAGSGPARPSAPASGPVLAVTTRDGPDGVAMALSMLGLRTRAFDGDEPPLGPHELRDLWRTFDALVDVPLDGAAWAEAARGGEVALLVASGAEPPPAARQWRPSSLATVPGPDSGEDPWRAICSVLDLAAPAAAFPVGAPRSWRSLRDDRAAARAFAGADRIHASALDDSPWVLPVGERWAPAAVDGPVRPSTSGPILDEPMTTGPGALMVLEETFPGNTAVFARDAVEFGAEGARLTLREAPLAGRRHRSGALASAKSFGHGRFSAEIRAAAGPGLVTGFFLHRDAPRQEIDVELLGADPTRMLANVFFNPGDEGASYGYGYRGSPCMIELGFDATAAFHEYAIAWRPGRIEWIVDGRVVHGRVGWDPTPVPHLPMRLHANLWSPRSQELAGAIRPGAPDASAVFRNVRIEG